MKQSLWRGMVWLAVLLTAGCGEDVSEDDLQNVFAGRWQGTMCEARWTLTLSQNATNLSGRYEQAVEPAVSADVAGSVSSLTTPATAILTTPGGQWFALTFTSQDSLVGTYNDPGPVCNVNATK